VTYHLNGAKGADHRGPNVDSWAHDLLPEQNAWGTRQWQAMQEKKAAEKSKVKGQRSKVKTETPETQDSGLRTQDSGLSSDAQTSSGNAEEWLAGDPNTIAVSQGDKKSAVARIRVAYSRLSEARFLGAKEIVTLFTRAVRRAGLPVAYSQGFHPAPRMSFGPGLPLGMESEEEFLDIFLTEALPPAELASRLDAQLPLGLAIHQTQAIGLKDPSIDVSIQATHYHVALDSLPADKQDVAFWTKCLDMFSAASTFPLQKRNRNGVKTIDAKQCVRQLALTTARTLYIEIAVTQTRTLNPQEFLKTLLGLSDNEGKTLRVTKIQTVFHSQPDTEDAEDAEMEVAPAEDEQTQASMNALASARDG
jgi:radical SAM-linked protein